jgi:tetratricopeptide (TPR) repeat protein
MTGPSTQRGLILLQQKRYPDAEKYFREALAADPNDALALYHLALCEINQQQAKAAEETIRRALSLAPDNANFHSLRAIILTRLKRVKDALAESDEALRIDPESDFAFTARASVFAARYEWAEAEGAARKALELNPENAAAASHLATALRAQNRLAESAEQIGYMLAQDPESAENHTAAGWLALQAGDHRKAETHFLEALRLEAGNKAARAGLKESFRARSPLYRGYLQYCFFMQRFTAGKRWMIMIGILVVAQFVRAMVPGPAGMAVIAIYFLLVLWTHVARAVGNLQVFCDRFARYSLSSGEKWEAWFAGGGVVVGLPAMLIGVFAGIHWLLALGLTLLGAAFPLSYTFTNTSRPGRWIFGGVGAFVYAAGLAVLLAPVLGGAGEELSGGMAGFAILAVIVTTYVANIPALNQRSLD